MYKYLFSFISFLIFPFSVFAVSSDNNTAITSAFTEGSTSVGLVVAGVITLAAAATGLGMILRFLTK
jgi:hypothetical protein